ncbi:possible high light inducible polypeptide HliC [Lyngbya sp. PCC 8106]|nr:possible high light inducible polypeptide HliC [Lyngbya sp. PCC 8106]
MLQVFGLYVKLCIGDRDKKKESLDMENQETKFGFTEFAETWNGRLAMLGFVIGLATEYLTGQGILSQIGIM